MFYALWDTLRPLPGHMDDTGPPLEGVILARSIKYLSFQTKIKLYKPKRDVWAQHEPRKIGKSRSIHTEVHFPSPASLTAALVVFPHLFHVAFPTGGRGEVSAVHPNSNLHSTALDGAGTLSGRCPTSASSTRIGRGANFCPGREEPLPAETREVLGCLRTSSVVCLPGSSLPL